MEEFIDQRISLKTCSTCKRELPSSFFARDAGKQSGLRSNCKECCRTSKTVWYQANKSTSYKRTKDRRETIKEAVRALKNGPCSDCGQSFHFSLMDFDHREGETKVESVAFFVHQFPNEKRVAEEIAKCDLVCCMCHRVRSWNRLHPDNTISALKDQTPVS